MLLKRFGLFENKNYLIEEIPLFPMAHTPVFVILRVQVSKIEVTG